MPRLARPAAGEPAERRPLDATQHSTMVCRRMGAEVGTRRAQLYSAAAGAAALSATLAACGSAVSERITAVSAATPARWTPAFPVRRVLDLSEPRSDGAIVLATAGRLGLLL